MKRWRSGLLILLVVALGSCGSSDGGGAAGGGHQHEHGPAPMAGATAEFGEPATASDADRTIQVETLDSLRFEPAQVDVETGEVIRFEVTNVGRLDHEFVLGDEAFHESDAARMNADHAHGTGVFVAPGETKEVIWRFSKAGEVVFACHVNDHYSAGMRGTLVVEAS